MHVNFAITQTHDLGIANANNNNNLKNYLKNIYLKYSL